jgi:hypothetical protein
MCLCVLLKTTLPRGYRRVNAIDAEVLKNQKTLPKLLSRSSARGHQEVIDLRQEVVHKKTHAIHKLLEDLCMHNVYAKQYGIGDGIQT